MLGFKSTPTGYVATDEQVAWWESRDTCPDCGTIVEPSTTVDGVHHYVCPIDRESWTRPV